MPKFIINNKTMEEQFNPIEYQKDLDRQNFITNVRQVLSGMLDQASILTKNPDEVRRWLTEDFGEEAKELTVDNLRGVQYDNNGDVANSDFEVIVKRRNE